MGFIYGRTVTAYRSQYVARDWPPVIRIGIVQAMRRYSFAMLTICGLHATTHSQRW